MTPSRTPGQRSFVATISRLIEECDRTQREIAVELGYERPNIVSMFKQGVSRVPLDKVPKLADALGADRAFLTNLWLETYAPEMKQVIDDNAGMSLSRTERAWIARLRKLYPGGLPQWNDVVERHLAALAGATRTS